MADQITKSDIETEAAWTSYYYDIPSHDALVLEASHILTSEYKNLIDSPETEAWLIQFLPEGESSIQEVKNSFENLYNTKIQTEEDRQRRDAAYDEFISGRETS